MRGKLTDAVQAKARGLMGRDITTVELRMMPYVQSVMMNAQKLDPRKINQEEREVLAVWRAAGHIEGGAGGLSITRDFWDILHDILFMAYVDI